MNRNGLILGKFLPPHLGHQYLCEFGLEMVDNLHIVVETREGDTIDGGQRVDWMRALIPNAHVHRLHKDMPQSPSEHHDFWAHWRSHLLTFVPEGIDYVFSSESYGFPLAQCLGAIHIPVDPHRRIFRTSGTLVRQNLYEHWDDLSVPVKDTLRKTISIFGPESTGKSTLTLQLAKYFRTEYAPEYARTYLEAHGRPPQQGDMTIIAKGQRRSIDLICPHAGPVFFTDTDPLATVLWNRFLFDSEASDLLCCARSTQVDLTILLSPDVEWVDDDVRYLPNQSQQFYEACREILEDEGRDYIEIKGNWEERFEMTVASVKALLK